MLCNAKSFGFLPSDPNVRKDPDRVSENSVLCSLYFTADLFTNKVQFNAGFSKR